MTFRNLLKNLEIANTPFRLLTKGNNFWTCFFDLDTLCTFICTHFEKKFIRKNSKKIKPILHSEHFSQMMKWFVQKAE